MKKSDVIIDALFYAVYMLGSCIVSCIAVAAVEFFIAKVICVYFPMDYFTLCIIRATIYTLGVNAILAIVSHRGGYKAAQCSIVGTAISCILAVVAHFMFCLLFRFNAFCAGGVKFIAALTMFGSNLNNASFIGEIALLDYIPYFFLNALIYCVVIVVFKKLGATKRLRDRAEMTKNN